MSPYTCAETVTYSLSLNPSGDKPDYVTINSSTGAVSITTNNTALTNDIPLRITVTRTSTVTSTMNFTLSFTNPCSTATITTEGRSISTITVGVGLTHTSDQYA